LKGDDEEDLFTPPPRGPLTLPGNYTVTLEKRVDGQTTRLGEPVTFTTELLGTATLPVSDRAKVVAFAKKTARLQRAVLGAVQLTAESHKRLDSLAKAITDAPAAPAALFDRAKELDLRLKDLELALSGDRVRAKYQEPTSTSINDRVQGLVYALWFSTSAPTGSHQRSYDVAAQEFTPVLAKLKALVETDLKDLESKVEAAGAPWTPGRVPTWTKE
jgi:hypothetical protein